MSVMSCKAVRVVILRWGYFSRWRNFRLGITDVLWVEVVLTTFFYSNLMSRTTKASIVNMILKEMGI